MKLYLKRGAATTNGLISVTTDGTATPYFNLHKPNELQQLKLLIDSDGYIAVTIVIGQYQFTVLNTDLWIEGTNQAARTIQQISDSLSLLFLEGGAGSGGGGSTTDNSTPPHVPFKSILGSLEDSNLIFDIEPIPTMGQYKLTGGSGEVSFQFWRQPTALKRQIQIGCIYPVISPNDPIYLFLDMQNDQVNLKGNNIDIGGTRQEAILRLQDALHTVAFGDVDFNGSGTGLFMNTQSSFIDISVDVTGANNCSLILDNTSGEGIARIGDVNGNQNFTQLFMQSNVGVAALYANGDTKLEMEMNNYARLSAGGDTKLLLDVVNGQCKMGDVDGLGNGTQVVVDNANGDIQLNANARVIIQALINAGGLPTYNDNNDALMSGATPGDFYKVSQFVSGPPQLLAIVY